MNWGSNLLEFKLTGGDSCRELQRGAGRLVRQISCCVVSYMLLLCTCRDPGRWCAFSLSLSHVGRLWVFPGWFGSCVSDVSVESVVSSLVLASGSTEMYRNELSKMWVFRFAAGVPLVVSRFSLMFVETLSVQQRFLLSGTKRRYFGRSQWRTRRTRISGIHVKRKRRNYDCGRLQSGRKAALCSHGKSDDRRLVRICRAKWAQESLL